MLELNFIITQSYYCIRYKHPRKSVSSLLVLPSGFTIYGQKNGANFLLGAHLVIQSNHQHRRITAS